MPRVLTKAEIEVVREREKKATAGPWFARHPYRLDHASTVRHFDILTGSANPKEADLRVAEVLAWRGDQDFIAHARMDIPNLLATIDAMQLVVDAAREFVNAPRPYSVESRWSNERNANKQADALIKLVNAVKEADHA